MWKLWEVSLPPVKGSIMMMLRGVAMKFVSLTESYRFGPLQVQCHSLSIDKNNAAVDQFLTSAIIFLVASQRGEGNHELY